MAIVRPAPARRIALTLTAAALGFVLLSVGVQAPRGGLILRALFIGGGIGALWGAWRIWVLSAVDLVLTEADLRQSDGRILCRFDQIERVERGLAAVRPATGFALHLRDPMPFAWVPGIWWRKGRRIGVGGMTNRAAAKALAEVIEAELRERGQAV